MADYESKFDSLRAKLEAIEARNGLLTPSRTTQAPTTHDPSANGTGQEPADDEEGEGNNPFADELVFQMNAQPATPSGNMFADSRARSAPEDDMSPLANGSVGGSSSFAEQTVSPIQMQAPSPPASQHQKQQPPPPPQQQQQQQKRQPSLQPPPEPSSKSSLQPSEFFGQLLQPSQSSQPSQPSRPSPQQTSSPATAVTPVTPVSAAPSPTSAAGPALTLKERSLLASCTVDELCRLAAPDYSVLFDKFQQTVRRSSERTRLSAAGQSERVGLRQTFDVVTGPNEKTMTLYRFADWLRNQSIDWYSFSDDQILALACAINHDLSGNITFAEFSSFLDCAVRETVGGVHRISVSRNGQRRMFILSEVPEDAWDSGAHTKFRYLAWRARRDKGMSVLPALLQSTNHRSCPPDRERFFHLLGLLDPGQAAMTFDKTQQGLLTSSDIDSIIAELTEAAAQQNQELIKYERIIERVSRQTYAIAHAHEAKRPPVDDTVPEDTPSIIRPTQDSVLTHLHSASAAFANRRTYERPPVDECFDAPSHVGKLKSKVTPAGPKQSQPARDTSIFKGPRWAQHPLAVQRERSRLYGEEEEVMQPVRKLPTNEVLWFERRRTKMLEG